MCLQWCLQKATPWSSHPMSYRNHIELQEEICMRYMSLKTVSNLRVDCSGYHTFGYFGHQWWGDKSHATATEVDLSDNPCWAIASSNELCYHNTHLATDVAYKKHKPRDSIEPREWIPRDTTHLDILVTNDEVMSHMPLMMEVDLSDDPCWAIMSSDEFCHSNTPLATDVALAASPLGAEVDMLPDAAPLGSPGGYSRPVLADLLNSILQWASPSTQKPEFSFHWSSLSAKTNWEVLQSYDLDLHKALWAQPFCSLTTGSEFWLTSVLKPLCHFHPLWPWVKQWLMEGTQYPCIWYLRLTISLISMWTMSTEIINPPSTVRNIWPTCWWMKSPGDGNLSCLVKWSCSCLEPSLLLWV